MSASVFAFYIDCRVRVSVPVPVLILYFGGEFFSVYAIRLGVMDAQTHTHTQLLTNTQYIYVLCDYRQQNVWGEISQSSAVLFFWANINAPRIYDGIRYAVSSICNAIGCTP